MKIGIDIDGVIAKDSIKNWMNKIQSAYPEFTIDKVNAYSIETITGLDKYTILNLFAQSVIEKEPCVYENCTRVINDLINAGHEVFITTSRDSIDLKDTTTKWLNKIGLVPKCHLIFCNNISKAEFAKENNLSIVIDDNIMEYVNETGRKYEVIIFSQDWNHTFNLKGDLIVVSSWEEIEEEIANIIFMKKDLKVNVRNRKN